MRIIVILTAVLGLAVSAAAAPTGGKLVIMTIGGTSLEEVTAPGLPNISRLIKEGAIGVMNARPASIRAIPGDIGVGRYSMEGGCATISAGTRTAATTDARKAYNTSNTLDGRSVRQLYYTFYGHSPDDAQVVHLGMNRLWFINSEARYLIEPGALASAIRSAGLKTAAVGNSDTPTDPRREAALIAADSNGIIDYGNVGSRLIIRDPSSPYGIRTDPEALLEAFKTAAGNANFIVVDVGDTARAANYALHCLEEQGARLRSYALQNADRIIGDILTHLDLYQDRIIILSPNPSSQAVDDYDFLSPVIIAGGGIGHGLLTSGSTHQPGIVTNTDISASVLDFFHIKPPFSFVGRPVRDIPGSVMALQDTNTRIMLQMERQPAMRGIANFLIFYMVVLSLYALLRRSREARYARWLTLVPIALILAVLWLPAIVDLPLAGSIATLVGLTIAVIAASALVTRSAFKAFGWLCGAVVLTVVGDLARGAVLLRDSIMSYTPVDGARYYGIGNEHMGSAIGAAMIGTGFLAAVLPLKRGVQTAVLALIMISFAAMLGIFGANAGGAISAAAAGIAGLMLWSGGKINRKNIAIAASVVAVALGLMLLFDLMRSGSAQSHIGRAVYLISAGGAGQILTIIERKIAMNLMLLQHSSWSKVLISAVIAVVVLLWNQRGKAFEYLRSSRHVYFGVIAASVGTLAALLLNDSGVVAAATASIYVWTAAMIAALSTRIEGEQGQQPSSPIRASEASPAQTAGHE